ncbi:MAG: DUF192 domain-containing protein [Treponema sp.]|nr:DUF192 domain-containing protein [Treponema sp.]
MNSSNFESKEAIPKTRSIGLRALKFFQIILLFFLCIDFLSCSPQENKLQEIQIQRDGQIVTAVKVEIADTDEERALGLMHRRELADGNGMLFVYERDDILSFWMKNTYIPLSIAFIAYDGRIINIKDMYPHDETPVTSSRSVRYALEVPQGWFSRTGVREGDTVMVRNN